MRGHGPGRRRPRSRIAAAGVAVALLWATGSGCYEYVTAANPPPLGERVALSLTDSGSAALAGYLGPGVTRVDGRLQSVSPAAVRLAVSRVVSRDAGVRGWDGESVTVPRALADAVQVRHTAWTRTVLAAVGGVALMVGIVDAFAVGAVGGSTPGNGSASR
jgi:hypothetical protein